MTILKAIVTRIGGKEILDLGQVRRGKMSVFRSMQGNGDLVCAFFDDCGEFTFEWNTADKVWEFFSEGGSLVGRIDVVRDEDAERVKTKKHYLAQKAAYAAQQRLG